MWHSEGVFIVPINKHKVEEDNGKKMQWDGVSIKMLGEFNDHQNGKWHAAVAAGHKNAMLITQPLLPQSMTLKQGKAMHEMDVVVAVREGRAVAMTAHCKATKGSPTDDSMTLFKILVHFPHKTKLSNKPFHSDEFVADPDMDPPVNVDHVITHVRSEMGWTVEAGVGDKTQVCPVFTCSSWIKWRFVDLSTQVDILGPKKKKKSASSKLGSLDKFESMTLDSDDEDEDGE